MTLLPALASKKDTVQDPLETFSPWEMFVPTLRTHYRHTPDDDVEVDFSFSLRDRAFIFHTQNRHNKYYILIARYLT